MDDFFEIKDQWTACESFHPVTILIEGRQHVDGGFKFRSKEAGFKWSWKSLPLLLGIAAPHPRPPKAANLSEFQPEPKVSVRIVAPSHYWTSRYIDRWKPTDAFGVLPEEYGEPGFLPEQHPGQLFQVSPFGCQRCSCWPFTSINSGNSRSLSHSHWVCLGWIPWFHCPSHLHLPTALAVRFSFPTWELLQQLCRNYVVFHLFGLTIGRKFQEN